MAAQDIEAALRDLGRNLEQLTGTTYANAGFRIVEEVKGSMRQNGPRQRTGNLYRSVGFVASEDGLVLTMANYGFYQNFGVLGVDSNPGVKQVTFGLKPKGNRKNYAFTEESIAQAKETAEAGGGFLPGFIIERMRFGIRAKDFIDVNELENILAEEYMINQLRAVENTFTDTYII